jgi:2-polyprenyl-3-methyl-5-hydroxy-6-metoxy-1,4-benzoquinol methylase
MSIDEIRQSYEERKNDPRVMEHGTHSHFISAMMSEREAVYTQLLNENFADLTKISLLEIGAGGGHNLHFFHQLGIPIQNLYANELLEDRQEMIRQRFPEMKLFAGDAREIDETQQFDVIFQSTVFTSLPTDELRNDIAAKMIRLTKPNGLILSYDFRYNNPNNKNVRAFTKKQIQETFGKNTTIQFYPVTLAPPIGRRIGKLYTIVNTLFPFLRSHIIAVIKKHA